MPLVGNGLIGRCYGQSAIHANQPPFSFLVLNRSQGPMAGRLRIFIALCKMSERGFLQPGKKNGSGDDSRIRYINGSGVAGGLFRCTRFFTPGGRFAGCGMAFPVLMVSYHGRFLGVNRIQACRCDGKQAENRNK